MPLLVMTGDDDAAAHADALRAAGLITKPFDPDDLLDAVAAAMRLPGSVPEGVNGYARSGEGERPLT